jgi:D-arabinose 1-dehydrogenase-like Zn-dependent alcohol dehydrogenase
VIVVGFQAGSGIDLDPRPLVLDEVTITGSRYASRAEIIATLDLVAQRRVEPVIGARYHLRDVAEAYRVMQENDVFGRIVVDVAAER